MPSPPPLSVIMPMYNAERFVAAAVQSVLDQSFADFEFLIVDDGSTDTSREIAEGFARQDSRITLLPQPNQGIVASLNRMISLATGHYVARMDADDVCLPQRFERQIAHLDANPHVGVVGTQFYEIDEFDRILVDQFRHPVGIQAVAAKLLIEQPIANPTAMFRSELLHSLGGFRSAFRYCEDYDLFLRLSRVSAIDNLPDVLFHYRRTKGQLSVAANSRQTRQAIKARFAHLEVLAGRPDPFEGLESLPRPEEMDTHVGRSGVSAEIRAAIARLLRFSPAALRGEEFVMMIEHAQSGRPFKGGWRTVARCARIGEPFRAIRLATALAVGQAKRLAAALNPL